MEPSGRNEQTIEAGGLELEVRRLWGGSSREPTIER
jgi:hypothetical protein